MIKKAIIILLIILVLGLYFYTEQTKEVINAAGANVKEITGDVYEDAAEKVAEGSSTLIDEIKNPKGHSK